MAEGLLSTGQFPSASGILLEDSLMLAGKQAKPFYVTMILEGNFGTGATNQLQALLTTPAGAQWVNVFNTTFNGNGTAVNASIGLTVLAEAVRLNTTIGTSPGAGSTAPYATLNAYPIKSAGLESRNFYVS